MKKKARHVISRKKFNETAKKLGKSCKLKGVFGYDNLADNRYVCTEPTHSKSHKKVDWSPE